MSEAMTSEDSNGANDAPTARTTIEVDRQVWRQVRAEAVSEGKNVSEKLEEILREHVELDKDDTDS
jgi:hypothetical protein